MLSKLTSQFSVKIEIGLSLRNWTQINGLPFDSKINRRTYNNLVGAHRLNAPTTRWAYCFNRFLDGSALWVIITAKNILHSQLCRSRTGFWIANVTTAQTIDDLHDCDTSAVNLSSGEMLHPSDPLSNMTVVTFSRSFVQAALWNITRDVANAPSFPSNMSGSYSPLYSPQTDPNRLILGWNFISRDQRDYSRMMQRQNSGVFTSQFADTLKTLLAPVGGARAFFIDSAGTVMFSSHSSSLQLRKYVPGVDNVDIGCWPSPSNDVLACQYNVSDYAEYSLVRAFYEQAGGADGTYSPKRLNSTIITAADGVKYFSSRSPLEIQIAVFTLLLFIPLDFWTGSIERATTTVIIAAS